MASETFDPTEEAGNFLSVLSSPVKTCSRYYAYYYLTEIDGRDEYAFDFKTLNEKLYNAFYHYGLYTTSSELANAPNKYYVRDQRLRKAVRGPMGDAMESHLEEFYPEEMKDRVFKMFQRLYKIKAKVLTNSWSIRQQYFHLCDILSIPGNERDFLNIVEEIFETIIPGEREWQKDGWAELFGGPAWAAITRVVNNRDDMPPTVFNDACWSLQHNNSIWLNKIPLDSDTMRMAIREFGENYEDPGAMEVTTLDDILPIILEAKREGDMETVFRYARLYDRDLKYVSP